MPRNRNLRWGAIRLEIERLEPLQRCAQRSCSSIPQAAAWIYLVQAWVGDSVTVCQELHLPIHFPFQMAKAAQFTTQRTVWERLSQNEINLDVFWAVESEMLKMIIQLERFHKEKFSHRFNLLKKCSWKRSLDANHQESHWVLCKITLHYSLKLAKLILLTPKAQSVEEFVNVMTLLLHRQQKMIFCGFVIANLTAVEDLRDLRQMVVKIIYGWLLYHLSRAC